AVAQGQPSAVREGDLEAVPDPPLALWRAVAGLLVVDDDPPGHAEVDPERGAAVGGLAPHRLAAALGGHQLAPDKRIGDLAGRVRAADVGVRVVDGGDRAAQSALGDERPRALDLR